MIVLTLLTGVFAGALAAHYLSTRRTIRELHHQHQIDRDRWQHQLDTLLTAATRPPVQHPDIAALISLTDRLCQRIQAPEQAVIDHSVAQPITPDMIPQAVNPELDDEYWDSRQISKEDLAEQAAAEELTVG